MASFGKDVMALPVVDISAYLSKSEESSAQCKLAAESLHQYGLLICRDSRISAGENEVFLDMMEAYYEQDDAVKAADARPELFYQVGVTPELVELPRNHCKRINANHSGEDKPLTLCPPGKDPKCRFFWRVGPRPESTEFAELNAEPVVPASIPEWSETLDAWGAKMLQTAEDAASMAAIGFGLPENSFRDMMQQGPHLLGPTGSDLNRWGAEGTVLAGYHYDLNFLTIHAKSRFPGLYVWTREGKRMAVKVPDGCLLIQAGKQAEHLTAGYVLAGYHEVVVSDRTREVVERRRAAGKSLWRVSSTVFSHIASDCMLQPLGEFAKRTGAEQFAPIKAGHLVQEELEKLKLA